MCFNPSQQLITTQLLTHPTTFPVGWGGESDERVKSVGWDKNSLIIEIKSNAVITTIIIIIVMKREIKKRGWNKTQEKQQCRTQLLTPWLMLSPSPAAISPSYPPPPSLCAEEMFYAMECPFGQLGSAVLAMLPLSFWCTCSLAGHGKPGSPWPTVSTAQQQPKHQCAVNIILILNSNTHHYASYWEEN